MKRGLTLEEIQEGFRKLPVESMHDVKSLTYRTYKELLVRSKIMSLLKTYEQFDVVKNRLTVDYDDTFSNDELINIYNEQYNVYMDDRKN